MQLVRSLRSSSLPFLLLGLVACGGSPPSQVPNDTSGGDADSDVAPSDNDDADADDGDALPGDVDDGDALPGDVDDGDALPGDGDDGDALPGDLDGGDALPGDLDGGDGDADTGGDSDPPQGDNVILDGSFEQWSGGLPVGWMGDATNIPAESVLRWDAAAHDGVHACQLINENATTHKRFSTQATALLAGDYQCSYWVFGQGQIRNARYDASSSSFSTYSGYTSVDEPSWRQVSYAFHLAADVESFELIFSVLGTAPEGLVLDHVRCTRAIEACDALGCAAWERCDEATPSCVPGAGRCNVLADCEEWQTCDATHTCVTAAERCTDNLDCEGETPLCNLSLRECMAGDLCADITCDEWRQCEPSSGACVLAAERCATTADCAAALPVCDVATHSCVSASEAANIVPNGDFELWEDVTFGVSTVYNLPAYWYGISDSSTPYFPTTEVQPSAVERYTTATLSGAAALKLVVPGTAERFVSELFTVSPLVTYSCAYHVRGHGVHRHRTYCSAWGPDTSFKAVDSLDWQRTTFDITSNSSKCVIIFYVGSTQADRDHVQIDDVVCSRKTAP